MSGVEVKHIAQISLPKERVQMFLGKPRSHFGQRCLERGIRSIPGDVLWYAVGEAVRGDRTDLVCRLFKTANGQTFYRFRVEEGVFYAVCDPHGNPVTCYTQKMFVEARDARKRHRRRRRAS